MIDKSMTEGLSSTAAAKMLISINLHTFAERINVNVYLCMKMYNYTFVKIGEKSHTIAVV